MKQREVIQTITYRWWRDDKSEVKESHIEELDQHADNHIVEMRVAGNTSGDLHTNLCTSNEDPNEGIDYSGFWEFSTRIG